MAGFFNRIINRFTAYDDYDTEYDDAVDYTYDDGNVTIGEDDVQEDYARPGRRSQPKVIDFKSASGQQVVIVNPRNMESAQEICNHLRAGRTVICNFEQIEQRIAQRVVDFITGSAYALDGHVHPISNLIFVIVPRQVTLLDGKEREDDSMEYLRQTAFSR